jgi:hypothetical protein
MIDQRLAQPLTYRCVRNSLRPRRVERHVNEHSVAELFAKLPEGWMSVRYQGRRWGVSRTRQVDGRVERVYAEELGGPGVVSANLYLPGADRPEQFRPCEMPAKDVLDFLKGWEP